MENKALYDINEVCNMFNTTSRTLRFYEEKGIISSYKDKFTGRRKYNENQIEQIKSVLILRSIGLSVNAIKRINDSGMDLRAELNLKKAEIQASIDAKYKELSMLNEAISMIENGKELTFNKENPMELDEKYVKIIKECTYAFVNGNFIVFYKWFSKKLQEYLPESVFTSITKDSLEYVGRFISFERIERDKSFPGIYYQYIKYERMGIRLKFVFHDNEISGFWFNYFNI